MTPRLLPREAIEAIFRNQASRFGTASQSYEWQALADLYDRLADLSLTEINLSSLTAHVGHAIAVDGPFGNLNRGTAAVAVEAMVELNGMVFSAANAEITMAFVDLGAGRMSIEGLAEWVDAHMTSSENAA